MPKYVSIKFVFVVIIAVAILIGAVFVLFRGMRKTPFSAKTLIPPQYLSFQIFTGSFNSEMLRQSFPPLTKDIANSVEDIISKIGAVGGNNKKLGFTVGPLSFDNTDNEIRKLIRDSFSIALEKNIATGFHIDDSMFWGRLTHLNSIENIEWLDWNKTPNTGRRIDWSSFPTKLMPQLCFNSPAVKKEIKKRSALIGEEVKRGMEILKSADKERLFLGIIAGWETQIGRDFDTGKYLGYCALTNKGYSAKNPPSDINEARADIVKEFIDFWSKSLTETGIDKKKIFSHTAFPTKRNYDEQRVNDSLPFNSYLEMANFSPPETAFGKYHNPGFSTYPTANLFQEIYEQLNKNNNPPWSSSEGTNIALPIFQGENSMEVYLARMFNHGASLVNIFGWEIGGEKGKNNPFRIEAERKESIDAYRKFLNGETLEELPLDTSNQKVLISPGIAHPKNAAEGLKRFTDQMDILTENGMSLFGFTANWKDLELSPYEFNLQENPINPLTLLLPKYPQVKGVVFVLKMIDTNWKPMPKDLETKSFDDPEVLKRFDALIDAIAAEPSTKRITHILLGNELDGYLGQHPEETSAFKTFYERGVNRIHQKMPNAKVGTIFTFAGVRGQPDIFNSFIKINQVSDFIDYTYYPVSDLVRGNVSVDWQMRPISEVAEHLHFMAKQAGNKPFAFTEIGYSSSPINNSSEEKQAEFVQEMFRVLEPYQKNGQIAFILYSFMYDGPPNLTEPYAREQGIEASKEFHAFMDNIGLRSYETSAPRKAWETFVNGVKEWNK